MADLNTLLFLMVVLFYVVGYSALISAMRIGEIAAVTPFRYSFMFWAAIGIFL